jgi:hypothetical protein
VPSKLSPEDAATIYRLECPRCAGPLRIVALWASDHGEPERIIDDALICDACNVSWILKRVTQALIGR